MSCSTKQTYSYYPGDRVGDWEWERRQPLVIEANKLHNVLYSIQDNKTLEEALKKERYEKHLRSKEMTKSWKNTVSGIRESRLNYVAQEKHRLQVERQKELEMFERESQEVKDKKIQYAAHQQFLERDDVKGFHSAVLHTHVLKERELQLQYKERKKEMDKLYEQDCYQEQLTLYKNQLEAEKWMHLEKLKQKQQYKRDLMDQMQQKQNRLMEEQQALRNELGQYKEKDQQWHQHITWTQHREKQECLSIQNELLKAVRDKQNGMISTKEMEKREAVVAKDWRDKKDRQTEIRKEIFDSRFGPKNHSKRMERAAMTFVPCNKRYDLIDQHVKRGIEEREAKEKLAEEEEKQRAIMEKKVLREIQQQELQKRKIEDEEEKEQKRIEGLEVSEVDREAKLEVQDKYRQARLQNKELQAYHLIQMEQNRLRKKQEKEEQLKYDQGMEDMLEREKQEFLQYARSVEAETWVPSSSPPSNSSSRTTSPGPIQAGQNATSRPFSKTVSPETRKILYGDGVSLRFKIRPFLDTGRRLGLY